MKNLPVGTKLKLNAKGANEGTMRGFFTGDIVTIVPNRFDVDDCDYRVECDSTGARGYLCKEGGGYEELTTKRGDELLEKLAKVEAELAEIKALIKADSEVPSFSSIVQRAQADVEKLEATLANRKDKEEGNFRYRCYRNKIEFHVNPKKGVVTALLRGYSFGTIHEKGFAKCHPNDTFNEHIGKAIAMRRACGLEVPAEYLGGK